MWVEYRKITTIKAIQVTKLNYRELADEVSVVTHAIPGAAPIRVGYIHTLEGRMSFNIGDWLAEGVEGERWPIKDSIFRKTYAEVK